MSKWKKLKLPKYLSPSYCDNPRINLTISTLTCVCVQSWPILRNPRNCSPPSFSVQGISQEISTPGPLQTGLQAATKMMFYQDHLIRKPSHCNSHNYFLFWKNTQVWNTLLETPPSLGAATRSSPAPAQPLMLCNSAPLTFCQALKHVL